MYPGVRVTSIEEKMTKSCQSWFSHMRRRLIKTPARKVDLIEYS